MVFASILAGGIGNRIGEKQPKQFIKINNKPILSHAIEKFTAINKFNKIIVSSPKEYIDETLELINTFFPNDDRLVVIEGGKERKDTINNSISYALKNGATKDSIMVTHDAARIFVKNELIRDSIKYAQMYGAASPIVPAIDVIFKSNDGNRLDSIPLRKHLFHSQTPQSFNIFKYVEIYDDLTEDEIKKLNEAMILFNLRNLPVYLFEGDNSNFKITSPFDIKIAEAMFND